MKQHVHDAVDEELALEAVARRARPTQAKHAVRLLLDMARGDTCGDPAWQRQQFALLARKLGQHTPDAAYSEPFEDLSYVLEHAEDDEANRKLCAAHLGEAWRSITPFRQPRAGDPYDVLLPHPEGDALALRALDRARVLPRPPSRAILQLAGEPVRITKCTTSKDQTLWLECVERRYDPALAHSLLANARAALEESRRAYRLLDAQQQGSHVFEMAWLDADAVEDAAQREVPRVEELRHVIGRYMGAGTGASPLSRARSLVETWSATPGVVLALYERLVPALERIDRAFRYLWLYCGLAEQRNQALVDLDLAEKAVATLSKTRVTTDEQRDAKDKALQSQRAVVDRYAKQINELTYLLGDFLTARLGGAA